MSNISKLIVRSKTAEIEYPGLSGFQITLAYLTREELQKMRKKCTVNKLNRVTRQMEEDVDSDMFNSLYVKAAIKGWRGLKFSHLAKLLPVDLSGVNPEEEVPYSPEDAEELVKSSIDFDTFLNSAINNLENFT